MRIDIRAKDKHDNTPAGFGCTLDLSMLTRWAAHPFPEPVIISGEAAFNGDYYEISYTANTTMQSICSRCLDDIRMPVERSFSHIAMEADDSISPWGDTVVLEDGTLDVTEMVSADLLLEIEGIPLCREDCPGLCPVCGKINDDSCGCETTPPDPRFDALRELLNNNE